MAELGKSRGSLKDLTLEWILRPELKMCTAAIIKRNFVGHLCRQLVNLIKVILLIICLNVPKFLSTWTSHIHHKSRCH